MPMKSCLSVLACVLFMAPAFAGNSAPLLHPGQFCGEQASQMREGLLADRNLPDALRGLTELFTDVSICTCTQSKLSASPYPVRRDDAGLRRYMRANADCLSAHIAAKFPESCPATYADLLPRLGYQAPTRIQVTGLCQCATDTFSSRLTGDALYASMLEAYEEANARVAAKSNPVFEAKTPRRQPMEVAFQELQACGAKVLDSTR
jgi:hypothetical protein